MSLKIDFNLRDAFSMFDKENKGYIFKTDFEYALNNLGVFASRLEVNLLFKKLDKDNDGRLRYSEFADGFLPIDKTYSDHLINKRSNANVKYPDDAFSYITKLDFVDTIRKLLKSEGYVEEFR